MKYGKLLVQAGTHRQKMVKVLSQIDQALEKLLDDHSASIQYQPSDGWVILFNDDYNAMIGSDELDKLLKMSKEEAFDYLMNKSI